MKLSDVIRELEKDDNLSKNTIKILANMQADIRHNKQGIAQCFGCYNELVGIVKGIVQFLNMHSSTLEALETKMKQENKKRDDVASDPDTLEEIVTPYKGSIQ